jgi:iron complex outermembrane recepter protein
MTRNTEIARAVKRALAMSAVAAAGVASLPAQAQTPTAAATDLDAESLTTVTVTGSRIRRVDLETASPVYTIDHTAIQNSGVATVGELVMQLPSINGAATNPTVNNGGGFGESYIELRGLDAKRTVILIDGRRLGLIGDPASGTSAVDVNQIPLAIIDHVEILKEGAGAIYGSDAIAGVVNFITRKDVNGIEVYADYGRTSADDGAHHQVNVTLGGQSDKLTFMLTGRYEQQDEILQGRRAFSQFALYDYSGSAFPNGSSRSPTGRINLPAGSPLAASFGNCASGSVTKKTGAAGTTLADFRCFNSGGPATDKYNYAPLNLLITPQERGSLFSKINYKINDDVEAYTSVLYNRTRSGYQLAALPFDATSDNIVLSKNSIYNPFGIDFGGISGANPDASYRLLGLNPRQSDSSSTSIEATLGLKGKLGATGWDWDLFSMYGRIDQTALITGYYFGNLMANAVGPSFLGAGGVPTCGTPAAPIAGCVPINMFAGNDPLSVTPAEKAAFSNVSTGYNTDHTFTTRNVALDFNGKVLTLPAGDMQASIGAEYRFQEGVFIADQLVQASPPLFNSCQISSETCTGNSRAHYSNKDFYGELFVPILKDLPGVKSLNVDLGVRFSDYTIFQKTTRGQIKVEYRPIADFMLRGTFAQVYRAPTIQDIAQAPATSSPTFTDPCNGLTAAKVAANPNLAKACVNVPLDGSFQEPNGQVSGVLLSNPNLRPETGEVSTFGFVYDASWLPGFSTTLDFWRYQINNEITQLDPNFSIAQCLASGSPVYCNLVTRFGAGPNAGIVDVFLEPTANEGTLKTNGIDVGFKYNIRATPVGAFRFTVDVTHVNSFTNNPGAGFATIEYAGTFNKQFGNDTHWRGLASIAWDYKGFDALASEQWIGKLVLPNGDPSPPPMSSAIFIPNIYYTNLSAGYTFGPTKTKLQIGVLNALNRQPPIFYQNNVINANTDVSTYDTIGRRWFVGIEQKF